MTEEIITAKFTNKTRVGRGTSPTGKRIMDSQEIRVVCCIMNMRRKDSEWENWPTWKEFLARSALSSKPKGDTKGDFAFNAAAMVRAGSKHRNKAAVNKNFPRCTSVGNFESSRPIGVISSDGVNARTCTLIRRTDVDRINVILIHLDKCRYSSMDIDRRRRVQSTR